MQQQPLPLPMPSPVRSRASRAVPDQPTSEEVARAGLLLVGNYVIIRVVVGKREEWKQPNPELGFLEAYVEKPGDKDIEAYLIKIYSPTPVNPGDTSTWQEGLEGKIIAGRYLASQKESISYSLPDQWATNNPQPEDNVSISVRIPGTILSAAGINSQEARKVYGQLSAPLSMTRSLSLEDLMYVRTHCIR